MNPIVTALIQGGIGFLIGAGTNDLAIRWVFYAIFGKKKHQIAAAVQKVVSEELMTPEKVAARLRSDAVIQSIHDSIETLFRELSERPLPSIDHLTQDEEAKSLDELQLHIAKLLTVAAERYLTTPSFREATLKPMLIRQWNDLVQEAPGVLLEGKPLRAMLTVPAQFAASLLTIPQREKLCGALADSFSMLIHSALTSDEIHNQICTEINGFLGDLRKRPIGDPQRFLTEETKPQLVDRLTKEIAEYAETHVAEFMIKTRIFDIISDSIIDYDKKKMEEVTRSVANRELIWVTLLGGVIGFIVGALQGVVIRLLEKIF